MFRQRQRDQNSHYSHGLQPGLNSLICSMDDFLLDPVFSSINGVTHKDFYDNKLQIRQVESDFLLFNSKDETVFPFWLVIL